MVNYRIFNALEVTGSNVSLQSAWGVMRGTAVCSGSVILEGFVTPSGSTPASTRATLKLEHLAIGEPVPCYVRSITVTSGTAYLLA